MSTADDAAAPAPKQASEPEEQCALCGGPIRPREGRYRVLGNVYDVPCFSKIYRPGATDC